MVLQEGKGDRRRPPSPARCRALLTPGRETTEPALALTLWGAQWVVLKQQRKEETGYSVRLHSALQVSCMSRALRLACAVMFEPACQNCYPRRSSLEEILLLHVLAFDECGQYGFTSLEDICRSSVATHAPLLNALASAAAPAPPTLLRARSREIRERLPPSHRGARKRHG